MCVLLIVAVSGCTESNKDENASDNNAVVTVIDNSAVIDNNITDTNDMMAIETSFGDFYYPAKWSEKINFTVNENQIDALSGDVKLFTIYFGGNKGEPYGVLVRNNKRIELRYEMYDIDNEESEFDDLCAMQDDINVIFQYLIYDGSLQEKI